VLVRPIFEPGDALFFDHFNLHRTAIDPGMTSDRHAIETCLLAPSTYGAMLSPNDEGYDPAIRYRSFSSPAASRSGDRAPGP